MPIKSGTIDIENFLQPDNTALHIARKWQEWDSYRQKWKEEKKELRNFIYATDTRTTSTNHLPWLNSTTVPKLTQIYDNLKANYTAALFPQEEWLHFDPGSPDDLIKQKAKTVQSYMKTKLTQSNFILEVDKLVDDYLLFGNCFATVEWVSEGHVTREGTDMAEYIQTYVGPRMTRISPYDIVFNPTSGSWKSSPKIIRSIVTLGELERMGYASEIIERMKSNRQLVGSGTETDKSDGYVADGFSSIEHYYNSGYVELLTFYGDIYDKYDNTLRENRKIIVADRAYEVSDEPIAGWLGEDPIYHAGWRTRPDNLYAMGPLDNLVGMQYSVDKLENLKADVFDQVAVPMLKIQGDVQDFEQQPGERIYIGTEGNVEYLSPEVTALQADNQIIMKTQMMEEFAGAPRQAMGIRTPGEKTAFEVQNLAEGASRIFQHKTAQFEKQFLEPIINAMLSSAVENMNFTDVIKVFDEQNNQSIFREVTRDEIVSNGKLRPVGARHFAEKSRRIQTVTNLINLKITDPTIGVHISGKEIARILAEELGEESVFDPNVLIREQMETQSQAQDVEAQGMMELQEKQELGI